MLHVIIYSNFPKSSGGRDNWLYNIIKITNENKIPVTIYSYFSLGKDFYEVKSFKYLRLVKIPSLRVFGKIFLIINKLMFNLPNLFDSFFIFNPMVKAAVRKSFSGGDTLLAMNSIIELKPIISDRDRLKDCRIFCSVRGQVIRELSEKAPWLYESFVNMERDLLPKCDGIISNGYDTKNYLDERGYKNVVVPNGVDVKRFYRPDFERKRLLEKIGIKNGKTKIIIMVASLRKIKGINDLLKTAEQMKNAYSQDPYKFVVVGKGSTIKFRDLLKTGGLEDDIIFLGERKDIPELLSLSDVVLCLSQGSGMSMSALEAMAACKPIVAWNTPVYQQLIINGESGLMVPFANHKRVAEAVREALVSPELSSRLGKNAFKSVQKYSWGSVYKRFSEVIDLEEKL
ncbi:glycosyltransferase family 4 protein [Patescibacteria group bacterium]